MGLLGLRRNARRFRLSLNQNQDFHRNLKIENWPEHNEAGLENILLYMEEFVFSDPVKKNNGDFHVALTITHDAPSTSRSLSIGQSNHVWSHEHSPSPFCTNGWNHLR